MLAVAFCQQVLVLPWLMRYSHSTHEIVQLTLGGWLSRAIANAIKCQAHPGSAVAGHAKLPPRSQTSQVDSDIRSWHVTVSWSKELKQPKPWQAATIESRPITTAASYSPCHQCHPRSSSHWALSRMLNPSMLRSFTACLYAMLWSFVLLYLLLFLSRLAKLWSKKNPNCPGWFWHSSGWCLTSSCPATIACFSWVTLEAHLFLHKESATAWVRVRSQDKRRWAWSLQLRSPHALNEDLHLNGTWTWDNSEYCYQ